MLAIFAFGYKFFTLGSHAFDVQELPWKLSTLMYYSMATFTSLGFGNVIPKTPNASWWLMFEVIVGYIMLGGLISIFISKLARRS